MERKKVYISGPITGVEGYRGAFGYAEKQILAHGHIPLNPAMLPDGMAQRDYMAICTAMIARADEVMLLPGYDKSAGSLVESFLAAKMDIPTFECHEWVEKNSPEGRAVI